MLPRTKAIAGENFHRSRFFIPKHLTPQKGGSIPTTGVNAIVAHDDAEGAPRKNANAAGASDTLGLAPGGRVPWAWGVNALASVLAAPLATLLAVQVGQYSVWIGGGICYVAAWGISRRAITAPGQKIVVGNEKEQGYRLLGK
jgi:hypothetical protein